MFDPLTLGIGTAIYLAFKKSGDTQHGILTAEREEAFRNAVEYCQDPQKLREIAKHYEKFGLKAQAFTLRKRADWRARSPEQKTTHDAIYAKALQSENAPAILEVANAFEAMTATVKAKQLRERAKSLIAARKPDAKPDMSRHTEKETDNDGLSGNSAAAE